MQKSFREFLGLPIRERTLKNILGRVTDFVINPSNGEVVAIFIRSDRQLLIPTVDISRMTSEALWVENVDALAKPDDIIRIQEIIRLNTPIYGNKVFTTDRTYLGKVIDYCLETNGWILTRLEVAKKILTIPTSRKLINSTQIIQIKPNEITVRDATIKLKDKPRRALTLAELSRSATSFKSKE